MRLLGALLFSFQTLHHCTSATTTGLTVGASSISLALGLTASIETHFNVSGVPVSLPTAASSTTGQCQAATVSCPDCDGAYIEDAIGKPYHVFCNNTLFSESNYAVQSYVTPGGCLAECANFTWCEGATYWEGGSCELAKGQDVFPQERLGYIAFLPVVLEGAGPAGPPKLSAFPTGDLTPPSATPSSNACDPSNISCPQCDRLNVKDALQDTYEVHCDLQPICNDVSTLYGNSSQRQCLVHCDRDSRCLAAIYDNGRCDLCQGWPEGSVVYALPHDYVVFIPQRLSHLSKPSTTSTPPLARTQCSTRKLMSSTIHTSWHRSISSVTPAPTVYRDAPPTLKQDINQVVCPGYNNLAVSDATNGRHYEIQCDTGFDAEAQSLVSASDFAACAASCTGDCGGIQFTGTECGLLTSISAVSRAPGTTAGAFIMYPNSAGGTGPKFNSSDRTASTSTIVNMS